MSEDRDDNDSSKGVPKKLQSWLKDAKSRGSSFFQGIKRRGPSRFEFDLKKVELKKVSEHSKWFRWGLTLIALFLLAEITARMIGLFVRSDHTPIPKKAAGPPPEGFGGASSSSADADSILKRNMFNVEGKIPQPFDQGLLDCRSQAKPSTQRIQLLGTIVMNDESHSVALVQEEGSPDKAAVKKDESFFNNKFLAKKIDRKELCFQVKASGEFEYVKIPDDADAMGANASLAGGAEGITPVSEKEFAVKRTFLDEKLKNLDSILQTARAVNYFEPGTGKFRGFQVVSIDPGSPFASLGVRSGDILTKVNSIVLDNPGKGLEAFQTLRSAPAIELEVIRGGEKATISYNVK